MLHCDDTECIEESLEISRENLEYHQQLVDYINELIFLRTTKETMYREIYNQALDDFYKKLKNRIEGLQNAEIQGEDMCPYANVNNGQCQYMNSDIGCSYCARNVDLEEMNEVLKQLKVGGNNDN